jgi:hypothetical protein
VSLIYAILNRRAAVHLPSVIPANFNGAKPITDPAQLLIESYTKAQEVVTRHEVLDSQHKSLI